MDRLADQGHEIIQGLGIDTQCAQVAESKLAERGDKNFIQLAVSSKFLQDLGSIFTNKASS